MQSLLLEMGVASALRIIKTQGDRVQHLSLDKLEGKGFFTKEIEEALLQSEIDIAVHCLKDLPSESPRGLVVAAIPARVSPLDVLISHPPARIDGRGPLGLRPGSIVGTSAIRRQAQLRGLDHSLRLKDLRGNVPTRIARLREGRYDAIVLAQAGLSRLGLVLEHLDVIPLAPEVFVPAPGQGALGLQCRSGDLSTLELLRRLHHDADATCVQAERGLLARLGAGCHVPLGALARRQPDGLRLDVFFDAGLYAGREPSPRRLTLTAPDPDSAVREAYAQLAKEP